MPPVANHQPRPTPRTLAEAYVAPAPDYEKSISHHYRNRHPQERIELVPDLAAELAALLSNASPCEIIP